MPIFRARLQNVFGRVIRVKRYSFFSSGTITSRTFDCSEIDNVYEIIARYFGSKLSAPLFFALDRNQFLTLSRPAKRRGGFLGARENGTLDECADSVQRPQQLCGQLKQNRKA